MRGWFAVYYRELLILRRRFKRLISSMCVSPLLYLIAFGYAMGGGVRMEGHSYMEFLIPGLVAMSSMTQSFGIAVEINISRFYWHIFEEFQAAPISDLAYVTGEVMAGMTRALLSALVIILLGFCFGIGLHYGVLFWLGIVLNSFVFSSLAVAMAMLVKSHADQAMLNSFVITPMAFLGGTFFPVDRLPVWAQAPISLMPLTHAASIIRGAALGKPLAAGSFTVLALFGILLFCVAYACVGKARD